MRIRKLLSGFDLILASAALAVLWGTIMLQVILRQVFNAPLMGADELTPFMLVWVIISPLGSVERLNGHIVMEELQVLFPAVVRKIIRFVISVSVIAIYVVVSLSVIVVFRNSMNVVTPLLRMPFWLFFLPSAIGFFLITIVCITRNVCSMLKKELAW
ncbi:MAG: TRAP transporter small permease subunit [Treponema sp.]|nr:TRAP transporter small permease subunit [Treponema sp.]